jgi:hypothetical protein
MHAVIEDVIDGASRLREIKGRRAMQTTPGRAVCRRMTAAAAATALSVGVCLVAQGFEPPPSLKASDLLPASLLKGPKHEVAQAVKGDGFLTAFTVRSPFGQWEAVDQEMLELRVAEVYALDRLSEFSTSEVFAAAVARAAEQKAKAVANVVSDPVGTAKALPGGIARFAKGVGRSVKGTADTISAEKEDKSPDTRTSEEKAMDAASAAGGAAESLLISSKRREWAAKIGADPYTSNELLAKKLDDVAWAAYAGGFALSVAMPSVPGLGMVEVADQLVYQLPPAELQKRNDERQRDRGHGGRRPARPALVGGLYDVERRHEPRGLAAREGCAEARGVDHGRGDASSEGGAAGTGLCGGREAGAQVRRKAHAD